MERILAISKKTARFCPTDQYQKMIVGLAMEQAKALAKEYDEISGRSPGAVGMTARFLGSMGGIAYDPVVYETLGIGGAVRGIYRLALREVIIGAGTEAVARRRKRLYENRYTIHMKIFTRRSH